MAGDTSSKFNLVYPSSAPTYSPETGEYEYEEDQQNTHNQVTATEVFNASFAPPPTGLHIAYWTTTAADSKEIESWLRSHITANNHDAIAFYGSFINRRTQETQHLQQPSYKWRKSEKDVADRFQQQLRWNDIGAPAFIHFLEHHLENEWATHGPVNAAVWSPELVCKAQEELYVAVFDRNERLRLWKAAGRDPDEFDERTRKEAEKRERKRLQDIAVAALALMGEGGG